MEASKTYACMGYIFIITLRFTYYKKCIHPYTPWNKLSCLILFHYVIQVALREVREHLTLVEVAEVEFNSMKAICQRKRKYHMLLMIITVLRIQDFVEMIVRTRIKISTKMKILGYQ